MRTLTRYYIPAVFYLLFSSQIFSQQISEKRITLDMKEVTLLEFIKEIEARTSFRFLANAQDIEGFERISVSATNEPLNEVLKKVFQNKNLQVRQSGKNILISRFKTAAPSSKRIVSGVQQRYSVHGSVRNASSGETIIGATISVKGSTQATASNEYGFYSISIPGGVHTLVISAIGQKTQEVQLKLSSNIQLDIEMENEQQELETVVVSSTTASRNLKSTQMSIDRINVQETKDLPVLFGERDVLKTIQLLPGIKPTGEGNSGFYVRGGASDQNLILLDEAPVYNPSHLLGFFSTFNSDAIKNVTVYKGTMPAQYGGRLSSVVDIKMNDGNNQDLHVNGGIGLISSRLTIEGPIQKNQSSFLLSGRRTYADMFIKLLGDSSFKKTNLYFYDLNLKSSFILGKKDRIYLSGYLGRDVFGREEFAGIDWGNITGTLRWNHIFNSKLFSNTSLIFSNYDYRIEVNLNAKRFQILSSIRDWNLKQEFQWYLNSVNTINVGVNSIYHNIKPGEISVSDVSGNTMEALSDRYSIENAAYISNEWKASGKIAVSYGLRISSFSVLGAGDFYTLDIDGQVKDTLRYGRGDIVKTYVNPEPRVSFTYLINELSSVKASYTRNTQNLHLVSNSTSSSPTDKWIASSNIIKPGIADQVAIGYYTIKANGKFEFSLEAYYKAMQNQIDYRNGAEVFTNDAIETQLLFGRGRAYGIEFLIKKKMGRLNGWVSYTLSKTQRRIEGINDNNWYNARQDRPHDIAIVGMYNLNEKWTLAANWIYYTGDAVTYPSGKYRIDEQVYFYYTERNGYRMPDYHRLDISVTKKFKQRKRFSSELSFSVFNVYGRANAFQIDFRQSKTDPEKTEAVKTSLFTFVPSISYNFSF